MFHFRARFYKKYSFGAKCVSMLGTKYDFEGASTNGNSRNALIYIFMISYTKRNGIMAGF